MSIERSVENLLARCTPEAVPERRRRRRIQIYAKGIEAKIRQARFALDRLRSLSIEDEGVTSTSTPEVLSNEEQAEFYNDCLWTFLFSAFDILGQVLNQTYNLGFDEREVNLVSVAQALSVKIGDPVAGQVEQLLRSNTFKTVKKYRHCSVHRRQIALTHVMAKITEAYSFSTVDVTGPSKTRQRLLCDDPYTIDPKFKKHRDLVDFAEAHIARTEKKISKILDCLLR